MAYQSISFASYRLFDKFYSTIQNYSVVNNVFNEEKPF